MGVFNWSKPLDKAVDIVKGVADTGMHIWDNSTLTSQEKMTGFKEMLLATKSQATSISRRYLLCFIIGANTLTLILAVFYSAIGATTRLDELVEIMEVWKLGWAFVAVCSFYLLTQVTMGKSK